MIHWPVLHSWTFEVQGNKNKTLTKKKNILWILRRFNGLFVRKPMRNFDQVLNRPDKAWETDEEGAALILDEEYLYWVMLACLYRHLCF